LQIGQRKEPRGEAAYGETAFAGERVPGVESAVALVEEREMSGDVSGGFDGAERADEIAFSEKSRGSRFDSGDAALDFPLGFVGQKGGVGWLFQKGQAAGAGSELNVGVAELLNERIHGAHVVYVGMGEGDAAEGCAESPDGSEYVIG
jgi:hypothetical protein